VPLPNDSFQDDPRWKLVERVAASREFQKSARLRQFLLYVCEKALTDSLHETHEQQIGLEVFDRRPGYNPSEDNIVRVEARELRRRLDRYFETEGANEPVRLHIPKGSYVPAFEGRDSATETPKPAAARTASPAVPDSGSDNMSLPLPRPGIPRVTAFRALIIALASFLLGLGIAAVYLRQGTPQTFPAGKAGTRADGGTPISLWSSLFDSQRPTTIVLSDASLVLLQMLTGQLVSLTDYSDTSYLTQPKMGHDSVLIGSRPYTSLADALLTAQLVQTAAVQHRSISVRYARDVKMRDLNYEDLIFIGSAYSDPWIHEFDENCNFVVQVDEATRRLYFLNKSPQKGEAQHYYAAGGDNRSNENFGLVTYLPNFRHGNNVLLIEGTNSVGTEAAGDFLTDPIYGAHLAQHLNLPADTSSFPHFQLLLKVTTLSNAPSALQVVARRVNSTPHGK
jgi:hypothetical protein